ncbi:hypothetical protein GCM10010342_71850 [Streptomyces anulatus]|nr:hypothetical protein GCM10010342_71850 [Streptomyces anulatus]
MPQLYEVASAEFTSAALRCDCVAHRFGNAAGHPERVLRYPWDTTDAERAVVRLLLSLPGWMWGRGGQLPSLASSLQAVLDQRKLLAGRIEELLEAHPLSQVLISMPGIGIRTGARILIEVGDGSSFPSAAHLAAYAGLAPATRNSGSSIRGEQPSRRGNKQLKRAFFLSAFAALGDPASRAYYDKKIAQGKHHTQALLCLARRRVSAYLPMCRGAYG